MTLQRAKNHEVTVRFGELKSLYGRRKHTASYMWPWHKEA